MPMAPPGPAELHLPFASGWRADLPFACTSCRGSRAQRIGRQARAAFLRRTARSRAGFRLHVVTSADPWERLRAGTARGEEERAGEYGRALSRRAPELFAGGGKFGRPRWRARSRLV